MKPPTELEDMAELLERAGELAKVGAWELDVRTMVLFWSRETCRIHELEPPIAPAFDKAVDFYAPEARPLVKIRRGRRACSDSRAEARYLFMSGYTADIVARQGVLDDGLNFLPKPFTKADLAAKVREVLDSPSSAAAISL
jgi:hypothetical protein